MKTSAASVRVHIDSRRERLRSQRAPAALLRCLLCVFVLALATVSARAQVQMFMGIGGVVSGMGGTQKAPLIPGESTDAQYPQWVPVLSMQQGVGLAVSFSPDRTVGKPSHSEVTVTKILDKATTSLFLLVNGVSGSLPVTLPIDFVTIDFRVNGVVFYRIQLEQVYITGVSSSSGGDIPHESLSLNYAKIRWSYRPPNDAKGTVVTTGWDVAANKAY